MREAIKVWIRNEKEIEEDIRYSLGIGKDSSFKNAPSDSQYFQGPTFCFPL